MNSSLVPYIFIAFLFSYSLKGQSSIGNSFNAPEEIYSLNSYREFSSMSIDYLLRNNKYRFFYRQLTNHSYKNKSKMVEYFLHRYPILILGNRGKSIHHYQLVVPKNKYKLLKKRNLFLDTIHKNTFKVHLSDFSYLRLEGYDTIRYIWWNPYIENFRNPKGFSGIQSTFIQKANKNEVAYVLLVSYYKNTLERTPENISNLFNLYKKYIFQSLSHSLYKRLKINRTVDLLIESHQHHKSHSLETWTKYYNRQTTKQSPTNSDWFYTFWNRRNIEGNSKIVYRILLEIQEHYKRSF